MDLPRLQHDAALLRRLHDRSRILVLANVWDVASAVVVEAAGFPALATASAGISAALGYRDGEQLSRGEMLEAVARITRAVRVPVTADLEAGYGDPAGTVEAALQAGAVGMNLEDSSGGKLVAIEEQQAKIRAARAAADRLGVPFVINARTDVYLLPGGAERFAQAVERARAYRSAGSDCSFVPGVIDAETIGRLVAAIEGPVNILARAGAPDVAALARLGVARVSTGPGLMRTALTAARRAVGELRDRGTYGFTEGNIPGPELDKLLQRE